MFKPEDSEEQQVEIVLLKSSLEEIGNELALHRSALPALDAENEEIYRQTMAALKNTNSLNDEIERLKLENAQLTAKRMQLKQQSDDISKSIARLRAARDELTELLKQEDRETELLIREYEDSLAEIAERFRSTRGYYNEEEIAMATEKVNAVNTQLANEAKKRQCMVDELVQQFNMLKPAIPEDILIIVGKEDLDGQIKQLTEKCDALIKERNMICNKKNACIENKSFQN